MRPPGEAWQVWRILSLHGIVYQTVGVGPGWSSLTQHRGPATRPLIAEAGDFGTPTNLPCTPQMGITGKPPSVQICGSRAAPCSGQTAATRTNQCSTRRIRSGRRAGTSQRAQTLTHADCHEAPDADYRPGQDTR